MEVILSRMRYNVIVVFILHLIFLTANKAITGEREDEYRTAMKLCCEQYKINLEAAKGCYCREWTQSFWNPGRTDHIRQRLALVIGWLAGLNSPAIDPNQFDAMIERNPDARSRARQLFEQQCTGAIRRYNLPIEDPGSPLCIICEENPVQRVFQPCGHASCCQECATKVIDCPSCRSPIVSLLPIFIHSAM